MGQFSRQMGATVGVAIFGTFLTHGLTDELPKHVPLLPGASEQRIDLAHAQSQAMNADVIRARVDSTLEERFAVIERAYHEDAAAVAEIVGDPRMPEQIKAALRDGGVRGRVHRQLVQRADTVESELQDRRGGTRAPAAGSGVARGREAAAGEHSSARAARAGAGRRRRQAVSRRDPREGGCDRRGDASSSRC